MKSWAPKLPEVLFTLHLKKAIYKRFRIWLAAAGSPVGGDMVRRNRLKRHVIPIAHQGRPKPAARAYRMAPFALQERRELRHVAVVPQERLA